MLSHEFGIMQVEPKKNQRFDEYEPCKYKCISIHDDYIQPILQELSSLDCYWHTLDIKKKGLAYYGITLIPPSSLDSFIKILSQNYSVEYYQLIDLLKLATQLDKYIIHFGI